MYVCMYACMCVYVRRFSVTDATFRLEPESQGTFMVTCKTRFSTPVFGRLTFRSRREGGVAAASLAFLLKSTVCVCVYFYVGFRSLNVFE